MGLISPGGEKLLDFLELQQVLSTYVGDLRDLLWWPQERPVPKRVARGPLGIPLPSMPAPKILCGVGVEPEDSSPVLTWILGYFWSLPRRVSPRLEGGAAELLKAALTAQLDELSKMTPAELKNQRYEKFRAYGAFDTVEAVADAVVEPETK